jgi:hypothetical protein
MQPKGGNVGIGTDNPGFSLHVVGNIYATGTITQGSDARFKKDVRPILGAMEYLRRMKGYWYERTDHETGRRQLGLSAQEVRQVFPEAVRIDPSTERFTLEYPCLVAPIIEGLKETDTTVRELQRGIVTLHRRVKELTEHAEELEEEVTKLKQRVAVTEAIGGGSFAAACGGGRVA